MKRRSHFGTLTRRSAASYLAGIALAVMMLEGCGGKGTPSPQTASTPTPAPTQPVGAVDSALVGTWNGSLEGSFGPGRFSMDPYCDGIGKDREYRRLQ